MKPDEFNLTAGEIANKSKSSTDKVDNPNDNNTPTTSSSTKSTNIIPHDVNHADHHLNNNNKLSSDPFLRAQEHQQHEEQEGQSTRSHNNLTTETHTERFTEQQLWGMSQAELINQVLRAQSTIQQLQNIGKSSTVKVQQSSKDLINNSENNPETFPKTLFSEISDSQEITAALKSQLCMEFSSSIACSSNITLQENISQDYVINQSPQIECPTNADLHVKSPSDLNLTQSPYVTTPPYEYILLTKENETRFRIFLNSRLDRVFKLELKKMVEEAQGQDSGQNSPIESVKSVGKVHHWLAGTELGLPMPHTSTSATVIHCFDPSDVDLELKTLLMEKSPVTHKIVRRKNRKERGSSVPNIDSYYGTKDLDKVGHASYFIPELSLSERKAIGWKEDYRYGKWKYSTPNIDKEPSGHSHSHFPLISSLNDIFSSRSKSKLKSSTPHISHFSQATESSSTKLKTAKSNKSHDNFSDGKTLENLKNLKNPNNKVDDENLSFMTLSDSQGTQSRHIIPNKHVLKRLIRWLMPCMNKKKSNTVLGEDISCPSSTNYFVENFNVEDNRPSSLPVSKSERGIRKDVIHCGQTKNHSHHHHNVQTGVLLGCFHQRHSQQSEVTGGDFYASTVNSVDSLSKTSENQEKVEETFRSLEQESVINTGFGETAISESFVKFQKSLEEEHWRTSSKIQTYETQSVDYSGQPQPQFSQSAMSDEIGLDSMQVSSVYMDHESETSTTTQADDGDNSDDENGEDNDENKWQGDYDDEDEDYYSEDTTDYENEEDPLAKSKMSKNSNNPYCWDYYVNQMPETRFLDPKDLLLPRYADLSPHVHLMEDYYYEEEDEDFYDENEFSVPDDPYEVPKYSKSSYKEDEENNIYFPDENDHFDPNVNNTNDIGCDSQQNIMQDHAPQACCSYSKN